MSDAVAVAVIGGTCAVLAGIPAAVAAVMTSRTRKVAEKQAEENTEQHGASQALLASLALEVGMTGHKVDALGAKVEDLADAHEGLAATVETHLAADKKDDDQ